MSSHLFNYLHFPPEGAHIPLSTLVNMVAQIANGILYLENRRMVHCDLASRNILVGDKIAGVPIIKVADFGLARLMDGWKLLHQVDRTRGSVAGKIHCEIRRLVLRCGIVLYEVVTRGQLPYPGMDKLDVIKQIELNYRMPCPQVCPDPIYGIMLQCWDAKPERRPTFEYLHQYFEDFFVQFKYDPPSADCPRLYL